MIGAGVHDCVYDPPKSLNGTLAVDLPFQTLAIDYLPNLSPLHTPEMLSSMSKSRISLFNADLALFVRRITIMVAESRREVSSFSKLTLKTGTTVAVGRPDNKKNRCAELGKK